MIVDSVLTIKREELARKEWDKLLGKLSFRDKDDNEVTAFDYVPGKGIVRIPRGAWSLVPNHVEVRDLRSRPLMPKLQYAKTLDDTGFEGQEAAVAAMFEHGQGQIIVGTGRGKTEVAYAFIAAAKTRTLVVVHTQELYQQWIDRAAESVPGLSVGRIRGHALEIEHVTIATAQTLRRYIRAGGKFWRQFGCIIIDEAHHAAAETWEWILNMCPAYYRFGLTASERRSDGREPLVKFNIGPVIYKLKFKSPVPMTVIPVGTGHHARYSAQQYSRLVRDIVQDDERNQQIAELTRKAVEDDRTVLVLSRQIKHLEAIAYYLEGWMVDHAVVTGRLVRSRRDNAILDMKNGDLRCILGTQLFEEGIDIPRLDCIVLAYPGTAITVLQKVGRGSRLYPDKTDTLIYDIVDDMVPVCTRQWEERKAWYKATEGVTIGKAVQHDQGKGKREGKRKSGADFIRALKVSRG